MNETSEPVIGRFAPTPSGPLHFGSLVTAVASYCQARSLQGRWLLRMEDVDTPRVVAGSADHILYTLEAFGFEWDGDVLYQSQRFAAYEQALEQLFNEGFIYRCECSRKSLMTQALAYGPLGMIYPGHCRQRHLSNKQLSLRLNVDGKGDIQFDDYYYGTYGLNLANDVGDVVLKRIDGIYAYHLAVVLDDAWQGVNQIVRGADLLEVTCLHLFLNEVFNFSSALYGHIPVIKNAAGKKLSKQTGAQPIDPDKAGHQLIQSLIALGQHAPKELTEATPAEILQYAVKHWQPKHIVQVKRPGTTA